MFISTVDGTKQTAVEAKLLKDGKALPLKEVDVLVQDDKVVFTVKKPSRAQTGIYQIRLGNAQGEDTKDITINMQGK